MEQTQGWTDGASTEDQLFLEEKVSWSMCKQMRVGVVQVTNNDYCCWAAQKVCYS